MQFSHNLATLDWLLEPSNPSVRYFTLVDLLGRPADDPQVQAARVAIMESGPVPRILAKQREEGTWGKPEDFYLRSKYKGTAWSFILLAELGADGADPRVQRAAEFLIERSQDASSGGYAYRSIHAAADPEALLPCLTGNLVWSLQRLGFAGHPAVRKGLEWIAAYQRFDDGDGGAPQGWPYGRFEKCWGRHTCMMGVVKALKALAEAPAGERTPEAQAALERGVEFVLRHHVYKRSHNPAQPANPDWSTFGFPRLWRTDALEILEILARLGVRDPRMEEAIRLVQAKRDSQDRWLLERSYAGRMQVELEREGQPSKWVTLSALRGLISMGHSFPTFY